MNKWINGKIVVIWLWMILFLSSFSWVLVGSVGYWVEHKWLPADSAGWAQAVGVILGIFVAILVPAIQGWQRISDRKSDDLLARRHSIKAVRSLLLHLEDRFQSVKRFYEPEPSNFGSVPMKSKGDSIWHDLKQSALMLHEIPVTALSTEMVEYMIKIRHIANYGQHLSGDGQGLSLRETDLIYVKNEIRGRLRLINLIKKDLDRIEMEISTKNL